MQDVARIAGITLADLAREFPHRDAIGEAVFDRADDALLAIAQSPGGGELDIRERLHRAVFAWLDALAPQRLIVRGILAYKFQPEHVHLQVGGAMRISRTVQTIREVALLRATGLRREAEEAALTSIYLATMALWLFDASPGSQRSRERVRRLISFTHAAAGWSG